MLYSELLIERRQLSLRSIRCNDMKT